MIEDFAAIVGGAIGCFGLGYALGRWMKSIRQFIDSI